CPYNVRILSGEALFKLRSLRQVRPPPPEGGRGREVDRTSVAVLDRIPRFLRCGFLIKACVGDGLGPLGLKQAVVAPPLRDGGPVAGQACPDVLQPPTARRGAGQDGLPGFGAARVAGGVETTRPGRLLQGLA